MFSHDDIIEERGDTLVLGGRWQTDKLEVGGCKNRGTIETELQTNDDSTFWVVIFEEKIGLTNERRFIDRLLYLRQPITKRRTENLQNISSFPPAYILD